jgi:LmbE family N-acetylglucosaminyl deacetylase
MKDLYVFAHPDDEIMIAGHIQRKSNDFYGIWLTNGSLGGNGRIREGESREAMKHLGVSGNRLYFIGVGEREIVNPDILRKTKRELSKIIDSLEVDKIYVDAYEGGQFIHDLANFLARSAFKGKVYEFPLYSCVATEKPTSIHIGNLNLAYPLSFLTGKVSIGRIEKWDYILHLSGEELKKKREMKKIYRSQRSLQFGFNLFCPDDIAGKEMIREVEVNRDYSIRPREFLLYETGPYKDFPVKGEKFPYFLRLIEECS